jgi:hypothetical protein
MTDQVWIAVHDNGTIEAYDDVDEARNATRDDTSPWVELVTIHHAPAVTDLTSKRRSWISPPNLIYTGPNDAA